MVYEGFRGLTIDIDLAFEVSQEWHANFIDTVRNLKDELAVNVKEASPGDFIPLPTGHEERAQFLGRYGQLDIFHFDLYSMVLSKIERGTEEDFSDALLLLNSGRINLEVLERHFAEILPRFGVSSLSQDPQEFSQKFAALKQMFRQSE
jgi:hypothetical protein